MYSSKESFDLTSASTYQTNNTDTGSKGCRLTVTTGFVLTFLAVAIAVGVGVVVHFANANSSKDVICHCNCGAATTAPSNGDNVIPQVCSILASAAFKPLCSLCPKPSITTSKPATTTSLSTTTTPAVTTTTAPPIRDIRLPTSLKPVHYNLRLRPVMNGSEPKNFTFSGDVEIIIECLSETNNITLHMKEMELTSDPEVTSDVGSPTYKNHTEDIARQFLIVHLSGALTAGQTYTLRLQFKGKMADNLLGLYKSYYTIGNKTVHLAFTTFEPNDARKAFPCFDEPAMKATYNISLDRVTDSDIMTLSNMPLIGSVQLNDGYTRDTFEKSVPMSTYLVAVAFTDFLGKTNYSSSGTKKPQQLDKILKEFRRSSIDDGETRCMIFCSKLVEGDQAVYMGSYYLSFISSRAEGGADIKFRQVRVYSRPDYINRTDLALQLNVELLDALESYFGIKYSLPKLDSIAAPHFMAGAMEHWGLVTYIDFALFYTPGETSTPYFDFTHVVISHELVHQWCGNLVSPAWWNDLWLNEGFATYLSYLGLDLIRPSWKTTEYQVVSGHHPVMEKDGYETSHPVLMDVQLPAEIWAIFDSITYDKAGAIIRMMRFFLGEDTFRYGIQEYLKSKEYDAANHNDLYTSLESRAHRDGLNISLENIMDTWIEQMNYPVVNVTFDSNLGKVSLHQQRFLFTCASNKTKCEESSYMWEIPFTYTTSDRQDFQPTYQNITWMAKTDRTKEITDANLPSSSDGWILGNIQQYGYYRVTYSQDNWDALQRQLMKDHTVIHTLNRAQLIDDAWALSKAGMLDVATALSMMNYLKNETEYTPWLAAKNDLQLIDTLLEPTKTYGKFEAYIVDLIKDHFEAIDITQIEHKSIQDRLLSAMIFDLACKHFIQRCEDQALQLFTDWRVNGKLIPPDVKATVMCTAVREGGETEWNYLYNLYKTSPPDAVKAINAMGCTRRHWLQRRLLDYSLMEDKIEKAHMRHAILAVANNPDGFHQALNFLIVNWKFLVTEYSDTKTLNYIVADVTRAMSTDNDIQQVTFWRDNIHPAGAEMVQTFDSSISKIKVNKYWFQNNLQKIDDWLNS